MAMRHAIRLSLLTGVLMGTVNAQVLPIDVLAESRTGAVLRGPVDIELQNLNRLKYEIRIGRNVRFEAALDMSLPFIPTFAQSVAAPAIDAVVGALGGNPNNAFIKSGRIGPPTADDIFVDLVHDFADIRQNWYEHGQAEIASFVESANRSHTSLLALVAASDQLLQIAGPEGLLPRMRKVRRDVAQVLRRRLPSAVIDETVAGSDRITRVLDSVLLRSSDIWLEDNRDKYQTLADAMRAFRATVIEYGESADSDALVAVNHTRLERWHTVLDGLEAAGATAFSATVPVGCDYSWDRTQRIVVELVKSERMVEGAPLSREVVATVECASVLSVSAGWGVTWEDVEKYGIVASAKKQEVAEGTRNMVDIIDESSFRPVPTVLLHMRVQEKAAWGGHFSVGATVDGAGGDNSGSDIEYLVGGSVSVGRSLFISGMLHLTRKATLAGGWEVEDVVPEGVDELPLRKGWGRGFAVLFTYRIR